MPDQQTYETLRDYTLADTDGQHRHLFTDESKIVVSNHTEPLPIETIKAVFSCATCATTLDEDPQ